MSQARYCSRIRDILLIMVCSHEGYILFRETDSKQDKNKQTLSYCDLCWQENETERYSKDWEMIPVGYRSNTLDHHPSLRVQFFSSKFFHSEYLCLSSF